ncbi:hypothetical protein IEQ34_009426 [Dendrobium chrysotoxum]|uniref:TORTIFOLIA1/SINE1-2 N-terminal domain-containing protein n=1 Tax=Dendrobium chrysotoxum TaxID=161865 RepID=A0AAV7GYJ3_DENCH|nr:hypothetical protein IEQ34_009426 [Dendrobium chrysotoxum]
MAKHRPEEMRQRVNLFMNKLSDRDTEAMAAAELESIARSLTADALPPFVSAVGDTRPTDKTPLRRHSLRLLSLLAHSLPPAALAPHLPRILAATLRRLRDPDSSVRTALIDAVRSLAAASPPSVLVPVILRPLADALLHEQDLNPQSVSAYSLAAALDETAAANAEHLTGFLHRLLPRLVKLVRSPASKAKPALLTLLGSVVAAGGIDGDAAALQAVIPCLVEFLACEDWSTRKAAAETLTRLAVAERDQLVGFKPSYLALFEARRYDKVKIVRDSMNRMMDVWKEIPDKDLNPSEFQPNSLKAENTSEGRFPLTSINSSSSVQSSSPFRARRSRQPTSRSPPPTESPIPSSVKKLVRPSIDLKPNSVVSRRISQAKNSDWRIEISVPDAGINEKGGKSGGDQVRADENGNGRSKLEARRVLFEKNCEEKKIDALKSGIKVVPLQENGSLELTGETGDELIVEQKDSDLSLIRMQLVQIEKQQSILLELLQKFIGSSQNGINSLEARVNSLEMTLNEISHDLVVPSSRNSDPAAKTCCRLPGTEFLSSKFWRRTDSRYSSRFLPDINDSGNRAAHDVYQWNKQKLGFTNPLAEINPCSRGISVQYTPKRLQENATSDTGSKHLQYD